MNQPALSAFIWSVADLLRGDYRQSEYGQIILPFTVLRRLDCVLADTKEAVLAEYAAKRTLDLNPEPFLLRKAGHSFYNVSLIDMKKLMGDQDNIKENLYAYIQAFSADVRDIFDHFDFYNQIERLAKAGLLYQVAERFAQIDLHPNRVSNAQMGLVFGELIRKFAEISNETAGEHFTPREVIRLMVNLLFVEDDEVLSKPGVVRTLYDPTAGTGGMLSVAGEYLGELNPQARLTVFGQELNPESHAICKADMLIKGQDVSNIVFGNTLSDDGHPFRKVEDRQGFVQLIDGSSFWQKMRKSLGSKRKEFSEEHIRDITRLFGEFVEAEMATVLDAEGNEVERCIVTTLETPPEAPAGGKVKLVPISRVLKNTDFGYHTITVERPQRDEEGNILLGQKGKQKGKPQPDTSLRDTENVLLDEDIEAYFKREVLPHAPDAWIDHDKTKVGYEIPFNRHFYVFEPPRPLEAIDAELKLVTDRIKAMIEGLTA